ncbi:MAG TPA: hypothetical protein VL551_10300 [Actinospica sp.]|jgi:hypothetical protein|nr:hypothetical protein [Actinospica sp.]
MDHVITMPDTAVALAVRRQGAGQTELSLVSILDGQIGDPVTWAGRIALDSQAAPFAAVADDIRAHLGDGVLAIHGRRGALPLIRAILPGWRPATLVDTRSLARLVRCQSGPDFTPLRIELGRGAAARARATARLLILACEATAMCSA